MPTSVLALQRTKDGLALVSNRRARPQWLGAVPLALLATLPLVGPGVVGAGRVIMALALGALAALWIGRSLPRRSLSRLERSGGKITIGRTVHEPLAIALVGVREDSTNSALSFRAELITPSSRVRLLDATDPAVVATQAEEIARFFDVPLEPGWGLPARALSGAKDGRRRGDPAELRVVGKPEPSQRAAGFTALGSTTFILCFVAVLLSSRLERGLLIETLSLVLPTLLVTFGLVVSCWILGLRSELSLSRNGLAYERYWFKQLLRRSLVPLSEIDGIYAVSPDGTVPTHVLTRVGGRWQSFELAGEPALQIAAGFQPISRQTDRPAQRAEIAESTEFSGARTANG